MNRMLPLHGELPAPDRPSRLAVSRKGFRPFFLVAAGFACAIVPAWLLVLFGYLRPTARLDAATWHAHEMLFGFTVAVIAGFLLTAVGNWTARETATGPALLGLVVVWGLGRVAMLGPGWIPLGVASALDLAFLPLLLVVLARPLVATGNRRNFVMVGVLAALFACNIVVHLEMLGVLIAGAGRHALHVALDVIVFLSVVIAGRVIPTFTRNATGQTGIEPIAPLEPLVIVVMLSVIAVDIAAPGTFVAQAAAGLAAVGVVARAARWGTLATARHPLLWILHAGYAWIAIGLLLRAAPLAGVAVPSSLATHALTLGAVGALTLGMMSRVALGHTGRPLHATATMRAAFALITVAALARVVAPILWPSAYGASLVAAGGAWTLAFALYLVDYLPVLLAPRVDGKPG